MLLKLFYETGTALRVGVTTVHEAMHENLLQSILLTNLYQSEKMIERRVNTAIARQSHKVQTLAGLLCVTVCRNNFGVIHYRTVLACTVYLYKVLIYNSSGPDIEMSHLRVTHLTVGQTNVLARCHKYRVSRYCVKIVEIRRGSVINNVTLAMLSDSPTIENHK